MQLKRHFCQNLSPLFLFALSIICMYCFFAVACLLEVFEINQVQWVSDFIISHEVCIFLFKKM